MQRDQIIDGLGMSGEIHGIRDKSEIREFEL